MTRRRAVQILLAFLLVIAATLGTARAHQVLSASQAHGRLVAAQSAADTELHHASTIGLLPAELAPFRSQASALDQDVPPTSNALWDSESERFYDRQAAAYQALTRRVVQQEKTVTRKTRLEASSKLNDLAKAIAEGQSLDLDVSRPSRTLAQQKAAFTQLGSSGTPGKYRALSAAVASVAGALARQSAARRQTVDSILAQSGNTTQGVQQRADAATSALSQPLWLFGLLSARGAVDQKTLDSLRQQVHEQTTPFQAAVKDADLDGAIAGVTADLKKSLPSKMIVVSTEDQSARMFEGASQVYSTPVTTGGPELPTDQGIFHIYMKISPFTFHSPWPPGSPYYYPPTPINYWMPFDGAEGLHDASWRSNFGPGSNLQPTDLGTGNYILGTHGCVNLPMAAAQFVWDWAPVGTTVVVI